MKYKKTLAGVAGLAVVAAGVPAMVFADGDTFTDNLSVRVSDSCVLRMLYDDGSNPAEAVTQRNLSATMTAGSLDHLGGLGSGSDTYSATVECNTSGKYWTLNASADSALQYIDNEEVIGSIEHNPVATGASYYHVGIEHGSSAGSYGLNIVDGFDANNGDYGVVGNLSTDPATSVMVAYGSAQYDDSGATPSTQSSDAFAPKYEVYVNTDQTPGTYTGKVVYTVAVTDTDPTPAP